MAIKWPAAFAIAADCNLCLAQVKCHCNAQARQVITMEAYVDGKPYHCTLITASVQTPNPQTKSWLAARHVRQPGERKLPNNAQGVVLLDT